MWYSICEANLRHKIKGIIDSDLQVFNIDAEALYPSIGMQDIMDVILDLIMTTSADFRKINEEKWESMLR